MLCVEVLRTRDQFSFIPRIIFGPVISRAFENLIIQVREFRVPGL
jgi:hypothetical protein